MSNKAREVINKLLDLGVFAFVENGKLKTRSKNNSITADIKKLIIDNKNEIIDYLINKQELDGAINIGKAQENKDGYPLSFSQQRLWFIDQLEGSNTQYIIPALLRLSGTVNIDAIQYAFSNIIERHESLRTIFENKGEEPLQIIQSNFEFQFPVLDLSSMNDAEQMQTVQNLTKEEANKVFDLSNDLMLRAQLLKLSADEHILLLTMHHIASDGWSVGILIRELSALYQAYVEGRENPLLPLNIQYTDYAYWQREWLQGNVLDRQIDYWKEKLSALPVVHSLPLDNTRPLQQTFAGAIVSDQLNTISLNRLKTLCDEQDTTLFMGLHALFSIFLARYSGETDIVIGSPIANREQVEVAGLIGFFVNTLVLRSDLSGSPSFIDILQRSKQTALDAYAHQQVPFEQLVEVLQPERSLNHSPLFQILLVLQNNSQEMLEMPGLTVSAVAQESIQAKYDITLNVVEANDGLTLGWEYNTDLFNAATIERMASHFITLAESLLSEPEENVYKYSVLNEIECDRQLIEWNDTAKEYPSDHCIHHSFEQQVKQTPDAIALSFEDQQLTYSELNTKANQLAHYLVNEKRVKPDTLVGICLERSLDMVIAILGVIKAGGAYVPLDPDYPEARLAYMLDDASLETVLTHSDILNNTPVTKSQAVCLDDKTIQQTLSVQAEHDLDTTSFNLGSNHLAYVIYTSGSTGQPKGVMVEHRAIVNRIHWMHEEYSATDQDVFLQKTPFSFDVSVWEFFWPLMAGSKLVMAKPQGHTDPNYLCDVIQIQHVTKLHFVPSMLSAMLMTEELKNCESIRQVFCSGEALGVQQTHDYYQALPNSELHNLYGPTEAAVDVSYWDCANIENTDTSVPIGRPINNIQLHVLDEHHHLLPLGVVGELHIGGVGLARGYLNQPELTQAKFIQNPFTDDSNDRLYKTGDLVRWLPDGNLEYLGRVDHQVKIRGFRIELGEIEHTLLTHEDINEVVVVARDEGGDNRLVAYVVADNEAAEHWRTHITQTLPDYMVPSVFVVLDKLPLTPNGKVDRKALPAPDVNQLQEEYIAPTTETEKLLCEIWQGLLGVECVGITDNFFKLGGHSLLLIQLLARLEKAGRKTNVRSLFGAATLGELAALLDKETGTNDVVFSVPPNVIPDDCDRLTPEMLPLIDLTQAAIDSIVETVPGGVKNIQDIYPLAPLQEGILFHHQMSEGSGDPYIIPMLLAVKTNQERDKLLSALQLIIDRHDVFRTAVLWQGLPQAAQVVYRHIELSVTSIEIDPAIDFMPQLMEKMSPAQQSMDITRGPLLRIQIAEDLSSSQYFILLQLHHIISDHVGLEVIQSEIKTILQGNITDLVLPAPYREFVAHALHQADTLDAETFFRDRLGTVTEPTAPFGLLDVHGDGVNIVEANQVLPSALARDIRIISKRLKISPAAFFHMAFGLVLGKCSNQEDVVFGTVLSGRLQGSANADRMLGMFINTLPFRLNLQSINVEAAVAQAQTELMALLPYEQASLVLAQQCSGLPSGTPLFSAILNYRHSDVGDNSNVIDMDINIESLGGQERTNYPFTMAIDDLGDDFAVTAQVSTVIDPVKVVDYLQTAAAGLVEALETDVEKNIFDINILTEKEKSQQLIQWNDTSVDYSEEQCIHILFEQKADKNPDAIALIFDNQQLTYNELNIKANQLAHYLINEKQIKPNTLVGICLDRSLEMIISILGILKAGGAYVPLDPKYPKARLAYMLDDASLKTVITNQDILEQTPITPDQGLCLDHEVVAQQLSSQLVSNVAPETIHLISSHIAYVIYTSGSTGHPKGVMVSHKNLQASTHARREYYDSTNISFLLLSSISFDSSVAGIFWTLSSGGKLCLPTDIAPDELEKVIVDQKVTHLLSLPSLYRELLNAWPIESLASLKSIIVAGEQCGHDVIRIHQQKNNTCLLFNEYGPTEGTVWSTVKQLDSIQDSQIISIGKPISNVQLYILDEQAQLVPVGVVGELYIAGAGVARGYLNQPDLTQEKFIQHPFSNDPNDRLYKTGDLVRWLPDGDLEFIGRVDDQVKIRGFRVELNEIENALLNYEGINQAAVLVLGEGGDKRLVAYIATETDGIKGWREHLSQTLPEYMVPAIFMVLDTLPLMPNGKINRKALPNPDINQLQNKYIAPTTETEQVLCEIWQDILNIERVGITDNFFQLGGHSLLLIQLLARLQETGRKTTVRRLFEVSTLGELAKLLDNTSGDTSTIEFIAPENLIPDGCDQLTPEMLPLIDLTQEIIDQIVENAPGGAKNIQDIYPLAPLQKGILFHHQMTEGDGNPYVSPILITVENNQQKNNLFNALQLVINRHDVLRTAVLWKDLPQAVQIVYRYVELPIKPIEVDVTNDLMPQLMEKMAPTQQSMDITQAPLLKIETVDDPQTGQSFILLRLHHIISDHVGLEIIQSEVNAILQNKSNLLVEPAPYREFVAHALHQEKTLDVERFFKGKLENITEPTAPYGLLDVHGNGGDIVEATQILPTELASKIRLICKNLKISPAALFHAVFSLVVGKCSGRDDVVFGTVLSGRLQGTVAADRILGMFINTLPFHLNLKNKKAEEVVLQAQSELMDLLPYEQASLALAQQCSGLSNGAPLFSAMLNYRHSTSVNVDENQVFNSGINFVKAHERTNYPFTVSIDDLVEGFGITAQVNAVIDPVRILNYLQTATEDLVSALDVNPQKAFLDIRILSEEETHQQLIDWNETAKEYPSDQCIHHLFEQQVERTPDAIALSFEDQQLTYSELNTKANQLAHYLVNEKRVKPDTLVGICLERSLEMVIAMLGIIKAGGAYVPLDPDYPQARLAYMLDDASLETVLTHSDILNNTPVTESQAVCLDDKTIQQTLSVQAEHDLDTTSFNLGSNHLAYVIYTSGSTGHPKGVMVEHRAIVNRIHWMHEEYSATDQDVFLQKTPFSFDVSVWEFFWPLMSGAKLVMAKPQGHTDPNYLCDVIQTQHVTKLHFVPSMLSAMLMTEELKNCESIRQVFCSGEALGVQQTHDYYQALPNSELHNLYGPTEAAVDVSYWDCANIDNTHTSVPIGRPINNIQLHVLDEHHHLLPRGVVGELHIGGVGLARGYLNREDLTQANFIQHPFSDDPNDRLYKTGDLVRWLPDGNLDYVGRVDHQVKIRGFRIELGEIEHTLLTHETINEVVVVAWEADGDNRLVAYVVADNEAIDDWRTHITQTLPDYMVPPVFVVLDKLPLTPNGKVDRKALPAPDVNQLQDEYIAPTTETEKLLCEIWQGLLGVECVGITDNFFKLGGHSLLLIQLLARLEKAGRKTNVRSLFGAATLGELAALLDKETGTNDVVFSVPPNVIPDDCDRLTPEMLPLIDLTQAAIDSIVETVPGGVKNIQDIYPLAPLQEGILFHHQMSEEGGDPYVMPSLLALKTNQQRQELLNALQIVINRHDVLRTAILWKDLPQSVQVVYRHVDLPIDKIEINPAADVMPQLMKKMAPEQQTVDITKAPLLRIQIADDSQSGRFYVLLQLHHIISDHMGIDIIQSEISAVLQEKIKLLTKPVQYREFVAHALHQAEILDAKAFFQNKLGSVTEPTTPFGLLDIHGDGSNIVEARQAFPIALANHVRAISKRLEVSPAALFHAVFGLIIAACSNRSDVVFGTVLSGRLQGMSNADRMLGMFINTLPLRLNFQDMNVEQIILQVQTELMALLPYEQASLALAQQRSGLPNGTPLFSAMLNYRHSMPINKDKKEVSDADIELLEGYERTSYPLTVSIDDLIENFEVTVQVNEKIDPICIINYFQITMENLVNALDENPKKIFLDIEISPKAERHQQLFEWNDTDTDYPEDQCIHHLFEQQVEQTPDAVALIFDNQELTYNELNIRANQLAHYLLHEKHVKPDTLVGVCLHRSLEMVVTILGILKAGGAYVPLDPDYPKARLTHMLDDAALETVITNKHILKSITLASEKSLCIDDLLIQKHLSTEITTNIILDEQPLNSNHLAYVIYTSGSTGVPKGVAVEHKNVVSLVKNIQYVSLSNETVMLHNASVTFDAATFELWGALLNGGILVIQPEHLLDIETLGSFLTQNNINTAWMTAGLFDQFVSLYENKLPDLKYLLVGGDVVSRHSVKKIKAINPDLNLINGYGPTENTTFSCCYLIDEEQSLKGSIPIGCPINNRQAYVLNAASPTKTLLPIGAVGELYVGGAGLARGYLNQPELTREKFIQNPFTNDPNDRLYKTGDLVRWLPDGNLEYVGRVDDQVKIRGFRIELGEIEHTLYMDASIKEAVVIAREDEVGDKRLVAYVVAETDAIEDWRDYLSQTLPEYMVPSAFVVLDKLPLTPNGKVDRKALPAPDMSQLQDEYVVPTTETETILCEIWQDILGVERVGVTDNFFKLGGHSLLAVRMIAQVEQLLESTISVRTVFEHSTVKALAVFIQHYKVKNIVDLPAIQPRQKQESIPLSLVQQSYWFLYQLEEGGTTYNIPLIFRLKGQLNIAALEKSLATLISRHENLRTRLMDDGEGPYQKVVSSSSWALEIVETNKMEVNELIKAYSMKAFKLNREAAFKAILFSLSTEEYVLNIVSHHAVMDGWSLDILLRELGQLYDAFCLNNDNPLKPLSIQYGDYAVWQHKYIKGERYNAQYEYWREKLDGLMPLLNLPTDYPRPSIQSYRGDRCSVNLSKSLSQQLSLYAESQGVTLYHVLLSGMAILLSRYTRTSDIPLGTAIANRPQQALEELVGCFANTVVLRCDIQSEQNFNTIVQKTRDVALDAFSHADVPFDGVVEAVQPERSLGVPPIFQVMFRLHNQAQGEGIELHNIKVKPFTSISRSSVELDLNISLIETSQGIQGEFAYATDLFCKETIERFIKHYTLLLESAMDKPNEAIANLPLLSEAELNTLEKWNDTNIAYTEYQCIHALFEETVARLPNKIAYTCGNEEYTYKQLNNKSNQLAHWLREQGIGPEVRVGVSVDRSCWMGITMLAIFKAGGTYVPLDPNYPKQRIEHMLDTAKPALVLTQAHLLTSLPGINSNIICLDRDEHKWDTYENTNPVHLPDAEHSAYILFTSGTTGRPKGILVAHHALRNMAVAQEACNLLDEDANILQFASFSFSISIWGSFMAWVAGGSLHQVTSEAAMAGEDLYQLIDDKKITTVSWPVSLLSVLPVDHIASSLHTIISTAEPCNDDVVARWIESGRRFVNMYGNSEVAIGSTLYEYKDENEKLTIGKPFPNTTMHLLDDQLQPVPIGVIAEIYTGGVGLARGYVDQPEITAEKFIHDPFSNNPDARLYKTGDLGRYLPNGEIEFMGREDFQVSIRGFRVELAEIEGILRVHDDIEEVAVVARSDRNNIAHLVCFYVTQNENIDNNNLRQCVADSLPNYMVPSLFIRLDSMPLTPNRKLDRLALPTPDINNLLVDSYIPAETELQMKLVNIWQTILGSNKVGIKDNFFSIGGNSLSALKLINQINEELKITLPVTKIFMQPTIVELSEYIQSQINKPSTSTLPLVMLNEGQLNEENFFLVPGVGGSLLNFYDLSKELGKIGDVYGLQAIGLEDESEPLESVEAIASENIQALLKYTPQKLYHLVGHSFGGWVAFEMAVQLIEQGHLVGSLTLLDSPAPNTINNQKRQEFSSGIQAQKLDDFISTMLNSNDLLKTSVMDEKFKQRIKTIASLQACMQYHPKTTLSDVTTIYIQVNEIINAEPNQQIDEWQAFFTQPIQSNHINSDHFGMLLGSHAGEISHMVARAIGNDMLDEENISLGEFE